MKFFKLLRFDLHHGILKRYKTILLMCIIVILACFDLINKLKSFEYTHYTYGEFLFYIFGGIKEYIPSPSESFPIPFLFLLWHMTILYFTSHYMYDDLTGFGQNLIYRFKSRTKWWLAKCIWNVLYVAAFYIFSLIAVLIFSKISGADTSLEVLNKSEIFIIGQYQIFSDIYPVTIELLVLPMFISITVSLLQMTLSLIVKPLISYILSSVIFIASAYYQTPYLLGNYAMAIRSDSIVTNGVNATAGVIFALCVSAVSVISGIFIFRRYAIMNSKEEN